MLRRFVLLVVFVAVFSALALSTVLCWSGRVPQATASLVDPVAVTAEAATSESASQEPEPDHDVAEPVLAPGPQPLVVRTDAPVTVVSEPTPGPDGLFHRAVVVQGEFGLERIEEDLQREPDGFKVLAKRRMKADVALVTVPRGVEPETVAKAAADHGAQVVRRLGRTSTYVITFPVQGPEDLPAMIGKVGTTLGGKATVEPDWIVTTMETPNDPYLGQLWGMNQATDVDIDAPEAWDISTGTLDVLVGVIDTGIDGSHPDLAPNMWTNPGESGVDALGNDKKTNGVDDDGNGYIDDWRGWDFVNNDNNPHDDHYHGTHCAGTVGARGNDGVGVVGVCWEVSLVGIKFLSASGSGTTSSAILAVDYGTTIGCDLTSNSWGGGGYSAALESAIAAAGEAGIGFVAAAGNSAANNDLTPHYPSSYTLDNIVAVAATTSTDTRASFSCYGLTSVDLGAPGASIYSTAPGSSYRNLSGTSMATPHVSGALALMRAVSPNMSFLDLKQHLMATVDVTAAMTGTTISGGRLNLAAALDAVAGAKVALDDVTAVEASGDGNGHFNPGEAVGLTITVKASGSEISEQIVGILTCTQEEVTIEQAEVAYGDLAPGDSSTGSGAFRIRVAEGTPTPFEAGLVLSLEGTNVPAQTFVFPIVYVTSSSISGTVSDEDGSPIVGAEVKLGTETQTTDAEGGYTFAVTDGDHTLVASASGFGPSAPLTVTTPPDQPDVDFVLGVPKIEVTPASLTISLPQESTATANVTISNPGLGQLDYTVATSASVTWQPTPDGLWHLSSHRSRDAGGTSWYYGIEGSRNYQTGGTNSGALNFGDVVIPSGPTAEFGFWEWRQTEASAYFDTCRVQVSTNGGSTWTQVYQSYLISSSGAFAQVTVNLSAYSGQTVKMRAYFDTVDSGANSYEGWYLDDFTMNGQALEHSWISVSPSAGSIVAGGTQGVAVQVSAIGKAAGIYEETITVSSNAANAETFVVPVTVQVTAIPKLELTWTSHEAPGYSDGDGVFEPGEGVQFNVFGKNIGGATAQGVTIYPVSQAVWASFPISQLPVGDIDPDIVLSTGFTAFVSDTAPASGTLTVDFTWKDAQGHTWKQSPSVSIKTNCTVTGTVTDLATGNPIASAQVYIGGKSVYTAADGTYTIANITGGTSIYAYVYRSGYDSINTYIPVLKDSVYNWTLGYTFMTVTPTSFTEVLAKGAAVERSVTLTNTGTIGYDLKQPYIYYTWLKPGVFGKDHLNPGESTTYSFTIDSTGQVYGNYYGYFYFPYAGKTTPSVSVSMGVASYSPPVADDQAVITDEDLPLDIVLTGVDSDDDPITFQILTQPANGTVTGYPPNVTFTPKADWNGTTSLTFTVKDGFFTSNPGTVTITVLPVDDAPVATNGSVTVPPDETSTFLFPGQDVDGDALTVSLLSELDYGTMTFNGLEATFTPPLGYVGSQSVQFTVSDASQTSAPAIMTILVKDEATAWPTYGNNPQHTSFQAVDLAPFGQPTHLWSTLSHSMVKHPVVRDGRVIMVVPNQAKAFDVTTGANLWNTTVTNVTSNFSTNGATVTEDGVYLQTCYSYNGTYLWRLDPVTGTVTWSEPLSAQWEGYLAPCVVGDRIWINGGAYGGAYGFTTAGTQLWFAGLQQYDDWTPAYANGVVYTYAGTAFTALNPDTGTVLWSIALPYGQIAYSANQAPVIDGGRAFIVQKNANWTMRTLTCIDLASKSVAWSLDCGATVYGSPAVHGSVGVIMTSAGTKEFNPTTGQWTGTVYPGFSPQYVATPVLTQDAVIVPDGATQTRIYELGNTVPKATLPAGGLIALTSNRLVLAGTNTLNTYKLGNRPPKVWNVSASTTEDTPVDVGLYGKDVDGDSLTWSIVSAPAEVAASISETTLTVVPAANWNGTATVTVEAFDGTVAAVCTVTITVTPVNDAPNANGYALTMIGNGVSAFTIDAVDVDGDALNLVLAEAPRNGTWKADGGLTSRYTPAAGFVGSDSFALTVSDGNLSATATITVEVLQPFAAKVNFQPKSTPPPGYVQDWGGVYRTRNGFTYGWNRTNDTSRSYPSLTGDVRTETLIHLQKKPDRFWEIAVPNGTYLVTLACGDPKFINQVNTVEIEGLTVTDPDGQDHFDTHKVQVLVADGQLTLAPSVLGSNAKLCYVKLVRVVP